MFCVGSRCGETGRGWGVAQGVATGVSVLYPSMEKNGLIDIDVLVQVLTGWRDSGLSVRA